MSLAQTELRRAAELTFESLAFAFPEHEIEPELDTRARAGPTVAAAVRFGGPYRGLLVVELTEQMVPELTANMLGDDEPHSTDEHADAVREITNVICGNLLASLALPSELFTILPPEMVPAGSRGANDEPLIAEVRLPMLEGDAHVRLYAQGGV